MTKPDEQMQAMLDAVLERPEVEATEVYRCALCQDTGFVVTVLGDKHEGQRVARRCTCLETVRRERRLREAGIPPRYANASFASFRVQDADPSVRIARQLCEQLAASLLTMDGDRGLLLTGSCGVGKTHLAVATLRTVMTQYGVRGRFWDMASLLTQIRASFQQRQRLDAYPEDNEHDLLREFAVADALVIDELGGEKLTEWAWSELFLLLNGRYNAGGERPRLTIITSNFPNLGPGERAPNGGETLGDRIGARMFSRLQEMTRHVEMVGRDYRRRGGR
jgi:DNA replication protein DnaC